MGMPELYPQKIRCHWSGVPPGQAWMVLFFFFWKVSPDDFNAQWNLRSALLEL